MMLEVVYKIAAEAKATITTEKTNPKVKPNKKLQIIKPKAIKPPILKKLPKKEKSSRVVKAIAVIPANISDVRMVAIGNMLGSLV